MITEADNPWELDTVGHKDYAKNLMTVVSLEDMADATTANLSGDVSDGTDESTSMENKGEAEDRKEQSAEEASFSKLSIEYEALKPMVADIIQKEPRSVLGERTTSNIRSLVLREIEVASNNISSDEAV